MGQEFFYARAVNVESPSFPSTTLIATRPITTPLRPPVQRDQGLGFASGSGRPCRPRPGVNPCPNVREPAHATMRRQGSVTARNARRQATSRHSATLATQRLKLHAKEGVVGSSPTEGSAKVPQGGTFLLGSACTFNSVQWIWVQQRVRDECLNINMFWSLAQARVVISDWKADYNRRHSARLPGASCPRCSPHPPMIDSH
jgi:hypothetical protein